MSIELKFETNPKIVDYLGRIIYLFIGRKYAMLFDTIDDLKNKND